MLILMRRENESIIIGDNIEITVTQIKGRQVHIGIKAPRDIDIRRSELEDVSQVGKAKPNG